MFIYAAIDKILDPYTFAADIRNYQIIPVMFSSILALFLPWVELFCGIFLILGIFTRTVTLLIVIMLITFIIVISQAMMRGLNIDCGCYHTMGSTAKVGFEKLFEDIFYLGLCMYLFLTVHIGPVLESIYAKKNE